MILNIFMYFVVLFLGLKRKDLQICGILFKDFEQKSSRRNLNVEKIKSFPSNFFRSFLQIKKRNKGHLFGKPVLWGSLN